eukprot:GHVU01073257.1.p1 GENE.GHVU01073257.1~~GHVU01073257.1.p1  ORF type:complete len:414 (+),score=63.32 GHVU01073257.1:176-1417(+)
MRFSSSISIIFILFIFDSFNRGNSQGANCGSGNPRPGKVTTPSWTTDGDTPDESAGGGYPVGNSTRTLLYSQATSGSGLISGDGVHGIEWELPQSGFPVGAWVMIEGALWCNWHISRNATLNALQVQLIADGSNTPVVCETGPVSAAQAIFSVAPNQDEKKVYFDRQYGNSQWHDPRFNAATWPFRNESLPTKGFDELYYGSSVDSEETIRIKIERDTNTTFKVTFDDNATASMEVPVFFDPIGVYKIQGLCLRGETAKMWGFNFPGVGGVPTVVPPTEIPATPPPGVPTRPGGGQWETPTTYIPAKEEGSASWVIPTLGASAGALALAAGSAGIYYLVKPAEEEEDYDEDPDEEDEDEDNEYYEDDTGSYISDGAYSNRDQKSSDMSEEQHMEVDPDSSFWRANTQDAGGFV